MSFPRKLIEAILAQAPQMLDAHDEENPMPGVVIDVDGRELFIVDDESYDGKLQLHISTVGEGPLPDGSGRNQYGSLVVWY